MRETVLSSTYFQESAEAAAQRKNRASRWQFILIISVSIALLFIVGGLFISGLAYLGLVEHAKIMSRIGTLMIVISAPLFILSAHCLDEIRFEKKRIKKNSYFKNFENNNLS